MDLEGIMLSEISQRKKDKYCMISHTWNLKKIKQTSEYNKNETDSQMSRTNQWLPVGKGKGEGARYGQGIKRHKTLCENK